MSAWTTPKTDWTATDYYNYDALDRVESNTEFLKDEFESIGYAPDIATLVTTRDYTSLIFYDDMNRIEENIKALADCSFEPPDWTTPKINWVSVVDIFDYNDAIRLENNLLQLKTMIDNIKDAFLFCGDSLTTVCGKGNTLF